MSKIRIHTRRVFRFGKECHGLAGKQGFNLLVKHMEPAYRPDKEGASHLCDLSQRPCGGGMTSVSIPLSPGMWLQASTCGKADSVKESGPRAVPT